MILGLLGPFGGGRAPLEVLTTEGGKNEFLKWGRRDTSSNSDKINHTMSTEVFEMHAMRQLLRGGTTRRPPGASTT